MIQYTKEEAKEIIASDIIKKKRSIKVKPTVQEVKNSILTLPLFQERGFRIINIEYARRDFCKLGTNKVKRRLSKLAQRNIRAKLFRTILDLEDANLNAKRYFGKNRQRYYENKNNLIGDVINLARKLELNHGYGVDEKQSYHDKVFYIDFNGIQFSWHCNETYPNVPKYESSWDGIKKSSLGKLEIGVTPKNCKDFS